MIKKLIFILCLLVNIAAAPGLVGGPCEYESFTGKCEIALAGKTIESLAQKESEGGPGYEGYEVKYRFIPSRPLNTEKIGWVKDIDEIINKEYTLLLANSWYPGKKFIEKYGIKQGAVFDCELSLITKGTCSPVVFKFGSIDTTDYFETKDN